MRAEAAVVGEGVAALKEARHPNPVGDSRVRTLLLAFLTGSAALVIVWVVVFLGRSVLLSAQTLHYAKSPDVENGEKVYKGGCIACHGSEGKGALADYAWIWGSADRRADQRRDRLYAGILQECPPRSAGRAKSATGIGYGEGVSRERDCDFYGGECLGSARVDYRYHR